MFKSLSVLLKSLFVRPVAPAPEPAPLTGAQRKHRFRVRQHLIQRFGFEDFEARDAVGLAQSFRPSVFEMRPLFAAEAIAVSYQRV